MARVEPIVGAETEKRNVSLSRYRRNRLRRTARTRVERHRTDMVEPGAGIEPATSSLQNWRSTN